MAEHIYQTATYGNGLSLAVKGKGVLGKDVALYAAIDDETGAVQLFVKPEDLPRLKTLKHLDNDDGSI